MRASRTSREVLTAVVQSAKEDDGCAIWTLSVGPHGYPLVNLGHKSFRAHRVACEWKWGVPPTPKHHAAHSCGVKACVNPYHLRWATALENHQDKMLHGTSNERWAKERACTVCGATFRPFPSRRAIQQTCLRRECVAEARSVARSGKGKYTHGEIRAIRARVAAGEVQAHVARELSIPITTLNAIVKRRAYARVD